jgi:uncharacterized protein YjbI with pentapeptide repeats
LNYPKFSVTLIAKTTVALTQGGPCRVLLEEESVPTGDVSYSDDESGKGAPRYESDFAYIKPAADVLVVGHFHAPGGKPIGVGEAVIGIDSRSVRMAVVGRRCWNGKGAYPTAASAEPFSKLELRWEHAFGGEGSVHNPIGVGYLAPPDRIDKLLAARDWHSHPLELPRIELFDHPWTHPRQLLDPICPAPRARTWPIRRERIGTCDARWLSSRWPWLPDDCDMRYFQAAAPSLQVAGYLRGNERLRFKNMHPTVPDYQTQLPGVRVIAAVQRAPQGNEGGPIEAVVMHLDTLWVDMDNETAQLVWRGHCATNDVDASDIVYAWADLESLTTVVGAAQTEERAARSIRADEAQWEIEPEQEPTLEAPDAPDEGFRLTIDPLTSAVASDARPPADGDPLLSPEQQSYLDELLKKAEVDVEAEQQASNAEHAAKAPLPWSRERVRSARQEGLSLQGLDLRGIDLSAEDFTGANLRGCLFAGAQLDGAVFCSANLSEASLEGATLDRVDFSGAQLDDADLSRTRGTHIKLHSCSLQRANLSHSQWPQAELKQADLQLAYAADARFDGATFDETTLDEANFERSSFDRTKFTKVSARGAQFAEARIAYGMFDDCQLQECDYTKAVLTESVFQESSLDDATLEKSLATGVCLLRCSIARLRAAESDMSAATVVACHGDDAIFERALLSGAVISDCGLQGADLSAAKLDHAHFRGCLLRGAKFARADLTRGFVLGCDCFESSFEGARLEECDGSQSSFFRAEFLDAEVATFFGQQRDLLGTKLARQA